MTLSTCYQGAEKALSTCLKTKCVCISDYKKSFAALNCAVNTWNINNAGKGAGGDNSSNITLTLTYTAVVAADDGCATADKQMTLNVLSAAADDKWGPVMRARVWRGDYPSAVGIEDTGEVYLLYLREYGLELRYFSQLAQNELEALENIHLDAPYELCVTPDILFKVLEGDVGNEAMRENVYVRLNGSVPMNIKYRERTL